MSQRADRTPTAYRFGRFRLDAERLLLEMGGESVPLGPKVVETLLVLVRHAGTLVTKDELMDALWPDGFVEEANLTQNVYLLRRTLRAHGLEPAIETLARRGYRFVAPVAPESSPAGPTAVVRRRIAAALAAGLLLFALPGAASNAARARPVSPEVARLYGMGRYYWNLRTVAGLRRSVTYFDQVVEHDPNSALGYAGLADAYTELVDYVCDGKPCPAVAAKAQRYARAAVARDPSSAAAHTSLAMTLRLFARDDAASDAEFERAIALDPADALAHEWYGNALLARGETKRARHELELAVGLQPVATATYGWLARNAYYDHRFAQAIAYAREALALDPRRIESLVILGLSHEQSGDAGRAIAAFRRLGAAGGDAVDAQLLIAGVYARFGERRRALAALRDAGASASTNPYVAHDRAFALVGAGEYARALESLKSLRFAARMDRTFFVLDPRLDAVRGDPRFRPWTVL